MLLTLKSGGKVCFRREVRGKCAILGEVREKYQEKYTPDVDQGVYFVKIGQDF